jgi:hypothetical protein
VAGEEEAVVVFEAFEVAVSDRVRGNDVDLDVADDQGVLL